MTEANSSDSKSEFESTLRSCSQQLLQSVEKGDFAEAASIIQDLSDARERSLYQELGHLTRTLHEAIKNLSLSDSTRHSEMDSFDDATSRLDYVIELTNKAANKTLDLVEESIPVSEHLATKAGQLSADWQKMLKKELKPQEFRALSKEMDSFLQACSKDSEVLQKNLSEILLAQDYQDLTGQVIMKVTDIVKSAEASLVQLVAMASHVERITGVRRPDDVEEVNSDNQDLKGYGPSIHPETRNDVVTNQDDVDDLLSSLGF